MSWLSLYVGPLLVIIKHKNSVSDVHLAVCLYSLFGFGIWFQQTFHWLNKSHHKNIAFTITFFPPNRKKTLLWLSFSLRGTAGRERGNSHLSLKSKPWLWNISTTFTGCLPLCTFSPNQIHTVFTLNGMMASYSLPLPPTYFTRRFTQKQKLTLNNPKYEKFLIVFMILTTRASNE